MKPILTIAALLAMVLIPTATADTYDSTATGDNDLRLTTHGTPTQIDAPYAKYGNGIHFSDGTEYATSSWDPTWDAVPFTLFIAMDFLDTTTGNEQDIGIFGNGDWVYASYFGGDLTINWAVAADACSESATFSGVTLGFHTISISYVPAAFLSPAHMIVKINGADVGESSTPVTCDFANFDTPQLHHLNIAADASGPMGGTFNMNVYEFRIWDTTVVDATLEHLRDPTDDTYAPNELEGTETAAYFFEPATPAEIGGSGGGAAKAIDIMLPPVFAIICLIVVLKAGGLTGLKPRTPK